MTFTDEELAADPLGAPRRAEAIHSAQLSLDGDADCNGLN